MGGGLAVGATGDADQVSVQAADTPGDIYLKLQGVTGGSTAKGHVGEIDVESYAWGVTNTATRGGSSSGGGSGRAQFKFVQRRRALRPLLAPPVALGGQGTHFATTTVRVLATGSTGPRPFMTYKFSDVVLNGYEHAGAGDRR